jgi:crotonobetainyl-CoA:carnitine CoA-transferase CaiB-like acyl-CoA transferase
MQEHLVGCPAAKTGGPPIYDLLAGIRVLELALLSPDAVGMHLADLGAEVIKVEQPPDGDYVRVIGGTHKGGLSLMHLRWNRGKKSVTLNLKSEEGHRVFLDLASRAHVVIDGLRAGAVTRVGVDYPSVRAVNPRIVYCSLSGTGQTGPYRDLATHGLAYDAYGGLAPPAFRSDGTPYLPPATPVGILAGPLYAALGVAAALVRAVKTGVGQHIDVAQMDCAAAWRADGIDAALNDVTTDYQGMEDAVRYQYYRCKDGEYVILQASERKFWQNFCSGVDREDLVNRGQREVGEHARGDEALRSELATIFASRTRGEWVQFFIEHDVAGGPVNSPAGLLDDPHFRARDLVFDQVHPQAGPGRWFGTPIQLVDQHFSASPAPRAGEHTDAVLGDLLGFDEQRLKELRQRGVIGPAALPENGSETSPHSS